MKNNKLKISKKFIAIFIYIILISCNQENSDILAVKKSKSDLGAMYEKTVEEVVQDVVGVNGSAKWSSFKPEGKFSDDVRLVEVDIEKNDTIVFKTICLQFIYNRSTGYVKQGAIMVNENKCSLQQWWCYYTNIQILNMLSNSKNESANNKHNTPSEVIKPSENNVNKSNEEDKMTTNNLSPLDPKALPENSTFIEYTSKARLDLKKGFTYGAEHPIKEETYITESPGSIVVDFNHRKTIIYQIINVEPFENGNNYTVKINGLRKTITKSLDSKGFLCFCLENEWLLEEIAESNEAGND